MCDEMLGGLARWLRAAGHDTALAQAGEPDHALIERCRSEERVLVSRDGDLVREARDSVTALLLGGGDMDQHAATLTQALGLDWTYAPFTRCMIDNTPLHPAEPEAVACIPPRARSLPGPFLMCPTCSRVFWPGSHVRRMQQRLQRWASLATEPARAPPPSPC